MKRHFYKLHGIGNDYIYFDCLTGELPEPGELAKKLSDRHFSIGGDGVIFVCASEIADAKMRMFNADGSEGKMCGNGIRCVGKLLYEFAGIRRRSLTVETLSGVKRLELFCEEGRVKRVRVDMGSPILDPSRIPVRTEGERAVALPMEFGAERFEVTCLSMGNPHCVVFCPDPEAVDLRALGPAIERHPAFPEGVNFELVKVISGRELAARVLERGSGETLACGTGACAAAVAGTLTGRCSLNEDVAVHLKGGDLTVRVTERSVFLTGPAELAFEGDVEL